MKLFYKALWMLWFFMCSFISTIFLRIKLLLCGAEGWQNVWAGGGKSPQVRISKDVLQLKILNNVRFNNYNDAGWYCRCAIWVRAGASLTIGNNCGFNGVLLYASNSIVIGDNVNIGGGTRIMDTDFHPLDYMERRNGINGTKAAPIVIENDAFIGANCIILKGITIGARSIVAAGSVVTKSIPSDEVWGGNPAKFIRKLF